MSDTETFVLFVIVAMLVAAIVVLAHRTGFRPGDGVIVRCLEGHLFTTIWIPGASFKALRLGPLRFQHCPVGDHWTFVVPVPPARLTDAERRSAAMHRDLPMP